MFLTASLCLHTCLSVLAERCRVQGGPCSRPKPLPGLTSCLIQLRGSEDTDILIRHCNPLDDSNKDTHNGHFVDDTACMAKLIQDAAQDRQGRVTSSPLHGQNLLDQWYANFSQCRVIVERHEIVNIILDSPNGKKPGPDGLPAAFLKRYCHQLAIIFSRSLDRACIWTCTH